MSTSDIDVVVADTDVARRVHYALRYQVFCLETGFEDASKYPDAQEKDEFDDRCEHFIVRNRRTGDWLATARLILPGHGPLPIERYCDVPRHTIPFDETAELSRLLIATHVRRRPHASAPHGGTKRLGRRGLSRRPSQLGAQEDRLQTARILCELLRAMAAYGLQSGIPYAAFFITPALARILKRMKIQLSQIGAPTQHRGIRFPYISNAIQVFGALNRFTYRDEGDPQLHYARPYRLYSELAGMANAGASWHEPIEKFGTWQ